jgi:hypothetical protein
MEKKIDINLIKDNYMSYEDCLECLCISRPTLQQHIRDKKRFTEPGDTLILPNRKRVFLKSAVEKELVKLLQFNGVKLKK